MTDHQNSSADSRDLIKMLDLHVDGVRHYLHLQLGKPLSKHLISAPEIALDNLHREVKAAIQSINDAQPAVEPDCWQWWFAKREMWCSLPDDSPENRAKLIGEGYKLRPLYASQPSPAATVETDVAEVVSRLRRIVGPISGETQPLMKQAADLIESLAAHKGSSAASEPDAWLAEYDGHTDATTDSDTVRIWIETLHRTVTPLYRAVPQPVSTIRQAEDALKGWLSYTEENLSEFDVDGESCTGDKLCPSCENSGCIQYKIEETRIALAALALSRPHGESGT